MIMKGQRNQAKKRPGLEFCDFRLEKNQAKNTLLLKNLLLIRISEILKKQNSNEKLMFNEKRAYRSTFAPQKNIKIKKAGS